MRSEKIRNGSTLRTKFYSESHGSISESMFLEIAEAENNYEKTFITVRDFLEEQKGEQHNLASEAARLSLTQGIADILRQTGLIRKDSK